MDKNDFSFGTYVRVVKGALADKVYKVFYIADYSLGVGIGDIATDIVYMDDVEITTEKDFNQSNEDLLK